MTKEQKRYCKIGQAVIEGIQMIGLVLIIITTFIYGIMN